MGSWINLGGLKNDTTAPSTPVIAATTASSTEIDITLTTPSTDAGGLRQYVLERSPNGTSSWTTLATGLSIFPYADTGLSSSTIYYYRCTASDIAANSSTSSTVNATTSSSGGSLVAPASGLTYQNRVFTDLNYASNAAALAGGVVTELSDGGTGVTRWSWAADPENAAIKCFKTTYVNNEDNAQCRAEFGPGKYVYFQWDEYWDPSFSSASAGKANRLMSPSAYASNYSDHIYYGAPGNSTYGFVMQGADTYDVKDSDHTGRSPALPKGQWVTMAVEHYITATNSGYAKLWQKVGTTWTLLPLDFTNVGGSFVSSQPYFIGKTSSDDTRKYGRAVVGGWVSGVTPGASDNRWLKNMLILWNDSTAPT